MGVVILVVVACISCYFFIKNNQDAKNSSDYILGQSRSNEDTQPHYPENVTPEEPVNDPYPDTQMQQSDNSCIGDELVTKTFKLQTDLADSDPSSKLKLQVVIPCSAEVSEGLDTESYLYQLVFHMGDVFINVTIPYEAGYIGVTSATTIFNHTQFGQLYRVEAEENGYYEIYYTNDAFESGNCAELGDVPDPCTHSTILVPDAGYVEVSVKFGSDEDQANTVKVADEFVRSMLVVKE